MNVNDVCEKCGLQKYVGGSFMPGPDGRRTEIAHYIHNDERCETLHFRREVLERLTAIEEKLIAWES